MQAQPWREFEITLAADHDYPHPYVDVEVWAEFSHDGGTTLRRPTFWDGGRDWKIRFASPFEDGRWTRVKQEGWFPYSGEADTEGNVWRQVDVGTRASINLRPHSWDDAEVFAIRYHDGEWAPFSPRSAAGSQPFPAAYVGQEELEGEDVSLWYVAHVHFDQSFPYTAGPWIRVS